LLAARELERRWTNWEAEWIMEGPLSSDDFELFRIVAQASLERCYTDGEPITDVQRAVSCTWAASGLIGNRGFVDHSEEELAEWAWAYDRLGILDAARAIRDAAAIMPLIDFSTDDPKEQELDPIENRFYAADEGLEKTVATYIREHSEEAFRDLRIAE
jgi:hypothetical protein